VACGSSWPAAARRCSGVSAMMPFAAHKKSMIVVNRNGLARDKVTLVFQLAYLYSMIRRSPPDPNKTEKPVLGNGRNRHRTKKLYQTRKELAGVVILRQMAAVRAVQVPAAFHLSRHPLHVPGIHTVVRVVNCSGFRPGSWTAFARPRGRRKALAHHRYRQCAAARAWRIQSS